MIDDPVVLETHAGYGVLYNACYRAVQDGIAIEKDTEKAEHLAQQRPEWCVYQADCLDVLKSGGTNHLPINFVDIDPYGEPWHVVDAYLHGRKELPDTWAIVVNDGIRQKLKSGGAWSTGSLHKMVLQYGNHSIYENYLDICQELMTQKASRRGYTLALWAGYYCGHAKQMTHYAAILEKA